ncbi:hypothetical protein GE09DRAFT_1105559 [Coniochaeta sp. 2T2.1]|nr:hypothetical protein GE09DRAFT_1105559 [Coniochaeta sp. 2T2.1]
MNRFRTKKRAKDDSSATEQQSSMSAFKSFRRGKKSTEEEPKKEFDLQSALPSDDNFRTSLLMTNLSARFSMLREQDDPNTKIGKASDDSVLYPKRQSRLGDFGFTAAYGGLSDIAEVESIKAPFLRGQVDSYISDDADSTRGGIMNRGKPTEGNVLFGGRQKIYKIPVGSKGSGTGGMAGRALYEDDVAVSAFQLWRQSERNRRSSGSDSNESTPVPPDAEEAELPRSESPSLLGYNRKRETSSTTSSASAIARYSTAATSVNSQPATSIRESHTTSTGNSSANSTPALERSVTRTRRLYEQALNQDMHGQQASAFSRIDTFARNRSIGNRTPDPAQVSPSPTSIGFLDRFGERRPLAKASAPNLRSLSPPTTASSSSTLDLGIKAGSQPGNRNLFGGSPPLSPPISETGDNGMLPIQPNDRGKATAMGVFQKPAEPYDESKYALRQLQLQSGRETPESRSRAESNASFAPTWRSQSSSSMQRQPLELKPESTRRIEPTVKEEYSNEGTFLDDSDGSPLFGTGKPTATPQVVLQRPSDTDHPAFRPTALPTPVSPSEMTMADSPEKHDNQNTSVPASQHTSPPDSPTLGPTTAGLSGMVRQHLRSESNTSSIYPNEPQTGGLDTRFTAESRDSMVNGFGAKSNPWVSQEQDYAAARSSRSTNEYAGNDDFKASSDRRSSSRPSTDEMESEPDEFASRLEDARRRVRERLTSYAEADSSRENSPHRHADTQRDTVGQLPQPNALGIGILKPKSSRGSLIDRSRSKVGGSQSKAMKMLGIGAATMAASPSASKQSFDEKDRETPRPSIEQEANVRDRRLDQQSTNGDAESEADNKSVKEKEDDNVHPGLRAFRNARRELQRRKELETLARHQASQMSSAGPQRTYEDQSETGSTRERTPSRERRPPPALYQQRAPSTEPRYRKGTPTDSSSSRQTSTERDRSGSEASHGRLDNRPPRLRNNSTPHDGNQQQKLQPTNGLRPLMLRSPGLPGTDIRRSPIMPPQGYPGSSTSSAAPSPKYLHGSRSATNLNVQPRSPYESISGQPSPISPLPDSLAGPPPGSMAPNGIRGRRPSVPQSPGFSTTTSTVNNSHRRTVNKHDISEPTFIMSTSRVPTVTLAEGTTRSRSGTDNSQTAPPLPPINPRRKRTGDDQDDSSTHPAASPLPSPRPVAGSNGYESTGRRRGASGTDDESSSVRAIRNTLAQNDGQRSPYYPQHPSPNQFIAAGPPASRTVLTPRLKPSNAGPPGGMF